MIGYSWCQLKRVVCDRSALHSPPVSEFCFFCFVLENFGCLGCIEQISWNFEKFENSSNMSGFLDHFPAQARKMKKKKKKIFLYFLNKSFSYILGIVLFRKTSYILGGKLKSSKNFKKSTLKKFLKMELFSPKLIIFFLKKNCKTWKTKICYTFLKKSYILNFLH